MMDFRENLQKFHEYVRALEDERRKIQMFQRELPLCLEIVTQAIETYKQQISGTSTATTTTNGHSDCSEQTTSDGPVFEEFMPIKRGCSSAGGCREEDENDAIDDDTELESHKKSVDFDNNEKYCSEKKSDWLSLNSVQLWNQSPDPPSTATNKEVHQMSQPRKIQVVEVKSNGAFHPFQKDKDNSDFHGEMEAAAPAPIPAPVPAGSACSSAERAGKKEGGQARKARRCWSPELHRRFLNALEQLGGSHAATPKQIRDLMKVDGLTNDEVKSHLQKYRLHSRRPASAVHSNTSTQAPQFVVVGGIWVPPAGAATTEMFGPPGQPQQSQKKQLSQSAGSSHSEGGCRSPATSSSTQGIVPSEA